MLLLKDTPAKEVIADKVYDANERIIKPLIKEGKEPRQYDKNLYKA